MAWGFLLFAMKCNLFIFVVFARVFPVMLFAYVFARLTRLARVGYGLVTMSALTLARESGPAKRQ